VEVHVITLLRVILALAQAVVVLFVTIQWLMTHKMIVNMKKIIMDRRTVVCGQEMVEATLAQGTVVRKIPRFLVCLIPIAMVV
jgi:hypothetical protein